MEKSIIKMILKWTLIVTGILASIYTIIVIALLITIKNTKGDSPAGKANWVLKESQKSIPCAKKDLSVPVYTTPEGIKFVRTPEDRFKNLSGYSFKANYININGLRMHYVDEGPKNGQVILLLHGQPSWSYLYRKMIPPLAQAGHRVIAVDLIGLGKSDKPVKMAIHTFENHVTWIKKFIKTKNLKNITLVCQDWGSIIGLRIAGDQSHLFSRIVAANGTLPVFKKGQNRLRVLNPVAINCDLKNRPPWKSSLRNLVYSSFRSKLPQVIQKSIRIISFQKWVTYALTAPDISAARVVEFATVNTLTKEELRAYDAPYPSLIYKAAIRTLPSMAAAIGEHNLNAWNNLGKFKKPFLFLAGDHDTNLGSKKNQNKFIKHVPGAKGQAHERYNAHHFIQEDVGELLAQKVVKFIRDNT